MIESKKGVVAVVGASSQIGLALLPRLQSAGYVVCRIGREDRSAVEGVTTHVFDERTNEFTPRLGQVDSVISLAPLPLIDSVLKMAQRLGAKRVIGFGSTGRYSKLGSTSAIEQDFVVQQERAENVFSLKSQEAGVGWTLFRPTMIYGAETDLTVAFIKSMIRRFGFFPVPIGARGLRQPVHVNDLAEACVLALGCGTTINRAYNLGGGEALVFPELVKRIFIGERKKPKIIPIPRGLFVLLVKIINIFPRARFVRKEMVDRMFQDLICDNQQAKNDFGYAPQEFII